MYIEKWRVLEHFWSQGDTLLSPTRVAILAGLETASLGLYALIYRVGSMRLDRFNVWGSGRSGHVSDSERRGQRGSLQVNRCVAEQIPASSCTSTEQQQQRQGDAEQQHHSSSVDITFFHTVSLRRLEVFAGNEEGTSTKHLLSSRHPEADTVIMPDHSLEMFRSCRRGFFFSKQAAVRRRKAAQPSNILISVVVECEAEASRLSHIDYAPQIASN